MIEHVASNVSDPNSVRKTVIVEAPQKVSWRVFTEQMATWWPLAVYKIGKANAVDAVVEPRVGGRWYERGEDGSTCDWGRVLAWEPYARLVLSWDITADWQYDPALQTEIEVRFIADGEARTRVELEHRRLDRYGDRRDEMRTIFDQTGDWGRLLASFAGTAAAAAKGGRMTDIARQRQALIERLLDGQGTASPGQRRKAFENAGLEEPLRTLIRKVATEASAVADRDIAAARAAGLTEDQVFEIVVCAAVGQSTRQHEAAVAALGLAAQRE